ncbi:hypothetical protein RN001_010868 [Aquatica leii]|uniref:Citrate transporter-like domain-containing protein n=1 Tax=Aquatica leii TaxID=1421715 RepID=A0AAN7PWV1_9COLE|nr:hypothetical protein RN001_010868 [Aquatica leii]
MYNVFRNVKMSATCSKVKTSAENLQENLISSSGTVRDLEISQQVQYTTDTVIKIVVAPSVKDVQITEIQNITLLQNNHINEPRFKWRLYVKYSKLIIFTILWLLSGVLISRKVPVQEHHQIDVPINQVKGYTLSEIPSTGKLGLKIEGALLPPYYSNLSTHYLYVWVQFQVLLNPLDDPSTVKKNNVLLSQNISDVWKIPIVSENLIGVVPEVQQKHLFKLGNFTVEPFTSCVVRIKMKTNLNANLPLSLSYNIQPINMDHGIIYAAAVLAGLYILIIFDIIHRSIAAIFASTMSVAILTALNAGPTMEEIVSWIDVKTLLLLFSMMTIVSISSETGVFEYITVLAYKLTNGKEWPLITALCFITAVVSCFLDNVTTGLLMTPITIRLCEVTRLNPVPVLISMILYSNIGGAVTPIGDPPNVIITSNPDVIKSGVNFATFTLHMGIGSLLVSIVTFIQLRYMFNNLKDLRYEEPEEVLELKREIAVCQRTADCMSSYSKNEDSVKETLKKRSIRLLEKLNTKKRIACSAVDNYTSNLEDLQKKYPIKDKILLIKCICILIFVVVLFFLHSIPGMSSLGLSGTAFLGAILLMLLYDRDDIESVVSRVEWLTLLFFGCLFILMEALAKLGLIEWIGKQTQDIIMSVQQESRLAVALLLILWVSALASTFVDNIPLTTMMIKVATVLADDVDLPLKPLVWALSLGACFGGNGTLFASSSNIVCASVAERHGYRFTFMQFMKIGFPVTITSLLIATVYLMVVHIVLGWE